MSENKENPFYIKVKDELNSVGCGMCLAKWTQVTLQLQSGHNHSCHHPRTHKISEEEIKRNPSALHNTRYKKARRKEMLEGKRPEECDYCWATEDNSNQFSDRIFKSAESWSYPYKDDIITSDWRADYNPKYVEVSFSNFCNFKCMYCGPSFSTSWTEEVRKHGGYPTTDNFNSLQHLENEGKKIYSINEENPYTKAFWEWWPDLYRDLNIFRITGGEPLLAPDTWWILDHIIKEENPNRNLSLAINTNLGVNETLINRLIDKVNKITDENRVKELIIFTSIDTWGDHAEYIRTGMVFNKFWDNVNKILERCPKINLTFMSTYNALSIFKYDRLITEIYNLKEKYNSNDRSWNSATFLDTSYLRHPQHQTIKVLPEEFSQYILNQSKLINYYSTPSFDNRNIGYSDVEVQKVKRLYDWMVSPQDENLLKQHRYNFYKYFTEHDIRRNTNFIKTFPELEQFYKECKKIKL
jgi:organic radical activating enzyme